MQQKGMEWIGMKDKEIGAKKKWELGTNRNKNNEVNKIISIEMMQRTRSRNRAKEPSENTICDRILTKGRYESGLCFRHNQSGGQR